MSHCHRELNGFRISAVPPFPGLRRFPEGRNFKQWTGDDTKGLMKVRIYLCLISLFLMLNRRIYPPLLVMFHEIWSGPLLPSPISATWFAVPSKMKTQYGPKVYICTTLCNTASPFAALGFAATSTFRDNTRLSIICAPSSVSVPPVVCAVQLRSHSTFVL